ncbi:MAG: COQ9 family protein, partial [Sneathiellaceae bacterium]
PDREAVRRALGRQAAPDQALTSVLGLYRTVDAMWYAAGDTATDWNFYTKRALLAGVYASTLLYWLQDQSEDFAATWAFLDRRVENVMAIQKLRGRLEQAGGRLPNPFRLLKPRPL